MSLVHCDVAVVGGELAGLVAGALLAHGHRRVVVIDDGECDEIALGEHLVPRTPSFWRLPTTGPAADVIEKLGLKQDARRVLGEPTAVGLVDDPLHRLILSPDAAEREKELVRALGEIGRDAASAIESLSSDARDGLLDEAALLGEDGFFARRRAKKRVDDGGPTFDPAHTDDAVRRLAATPLSDVLPWVAPFVAHDDRWKKDELSGFMATWLLKGGTVSHPTEGTSLRGALSRRFFHTIEGHGGDVLRGTRVRSIDGDARNLTIVRTDGKNDYAVRAVVDATESLTLSARLPEGRGRSETIAAEGQVSLVGTSAIVRWILPRSALPRGIPARTILLPNDDHGIGIAVAIFDGLPMRDGRMPKDASDQVALVAAAKTCNDVTSEALADLIEKRLRSVVPFSNRLASVRDRLIDDDARRALPIFRPSAKCHALGGRRPLTGFKNLARAGRDVAPRLGLEGEIAAAKSAAAVILDVFGKDRSRAD